MSYRIFLLGLIKSFALANFDTFELLRNVYNRVQFTPPPPHTHTDRICLEFRNFRSD